MVPLNPIRTADEMILPCRTSGSENVGTAVSVTTSAAITTFATINTSFTSGGAYVTIQARGGDVYVRSVGVGDSAAAGTTSGNSSSGYKIADGATQHFYVDIGTIRGLDMIGSASCTAFVWMSSNRYTNR